MAEIAVVHFANRPKGQSRAGMAAVMEYTMREEKTQWQGQQLVSGVNCRPETVYDDFLRTKLLYHKDSGTMYYHMVQSFPKGEKVDPITAHAAALKLAEYFRDYEVLVCTHTDRDHIHSHFVINSVNFETGKKLHMAKEQIQELMFRNDQICMEFGLPVFQKMRKQKMKPMSGGEYHAATKGQSWKFRLMNTIDECMRRARSKEEFRSLLESEGYQLRWTDTRKNITYTTPDGKRCRDDRLHDEKYLKENMEYEFRIRQEIIDRRVESVEPDGRKRTRFLDDKYADRDQGGVYHLPGTGGGTDRADGADGQRAAGDRGEAGQAVHRGGTEEGPSAAGADRHSGGTGWEKERAALFSAPAQSPGVQSHVAVGHSGGGGSAGGVLHAVAELGHSVEVLSEPDPVMDATTAPAHIDKKRWSELQEKRIAAGHKPDDHDEQQNYQQQM